ncbi:hypothetical protein [Arsenophonus sp. PmNCSU2021_1]|uniref:hypothetical protein n=1 Tax=Arsenophonus sp. PmNCSU2021_1 TaxID=3118989 RepID=UPI002FF1708F
MRNSCQIEANYPKVENIFMSLVEGLINGEIYQQRKQLTSSVGHQLKFSLLHEFRTGI